MRNGKDSFVDLPGLRIIHQNIPGMVVRRVQLAEHLLFVPIDGEVRIELDSDVRTVRPGAGLYLPPRLTHSFAASAHGGERLILLAHPQKAGLSGAPTVPTSVTVVPLIKHLCAFLVTRGQSDDATLRPARALLLVLLRETLSQSSSEAPVDPSDIRLRRAIEILRSECDRRLTMDAVARRAGLSLRNFNRLILKETGMRPKQWHTAVRLDEARRLLTQPYATVTRVALAVGYQSPGQFSFAFRQRFGVTPGDYQRSHQLGQIRHDDGQMS